MLSVTQKSTLSQQQQQQQPRQNHQTNPPQSVPFPFPFPFSSYSLPFVALHALAAVDKALQFACHLLWQLIVGLPSCQTPLGNPLTVATRAYWRLWAIANKKGGKSTLLWHLILILLPYLSIDSGDCRCGGMCSMGHGADTFCALTFDVIR